jgi:hypothetical protein
MLSGVMISKSFLPTLGVQIQTGQAWRQLHSLSTTAGMWLVGLHFALSGNWIIAALKRYLVAPLARLVPVFHRQARVAVTRASVFCPVGPSIFNAAWRPAQRQRTRLWAAYKEIRARAMMVPVEIGVEL